MKPLFVLLGTFLVTLLIIRLSGGPWNYWLAGRIGMAVMLLFTAIAHFVFTRGMVMMLPAFVPFKKGMVYFTGIVEVAGAAGLLILRWPWFSMIGLLLIVLFMLMLPANIYAALHHIDYEKGTLDGKGPRYLWFRIPLQAFFIAWIIFLIV